MEIITIVCAASLMVIAFVSHYAVRIYHKMYLLQDKVYLLEAAIKNDRSMNAETLMYCLNQIMKEALNPAVEDYATAARCFKLINELKESIKNG